MGLLCDGIMYSKPIPLEKFYFYLFLLRSKVCQLSLSVFYMHP